MDSIWVSADALRQLIEPLQEENEEDFLKKETYLQRSDSLSLYLIYVKNVRLRNEHASLSYARHIIKEIMLYKRKLQFTKKFDKNIIKKASNKKIIQIY